MILLTTEAGLRRNILDWFLNRSQPSEPWGSPPEYSGLSSVGKIWIIATMFVGRLGPLTVAMWMVPCTRPMYAIPKDVMIG